MFFAIVEFKAHPPAFQAAPFKGGETIKIKSGCCFLLVFPL
jgi:hypothetical protein